MARGKSQGTFDHGSGLRGAELMELGVSYSRNLSIIPIPFGKPTFPYALGQIILLY